jgi:hypothetical protein
LCRCSRRRGASHHFAPSGGPRSWFMLANGTFPAMTAGLGRGGMRPIHRVADRRSCGRMPRLRVSGVADPVGSDGRPTVRSYLRAASVSAAAF